MDRLGQGDDEERGDNHEQRLDEEHPEVGRVRFKVPQREKARSAPEEHDGDPVDLSADVFVQPAALAGDVARANRQRTDNGERKELKGAWVHGLSLVPASGRSRK